MISRVLQYVRLAYLLITIYAVLRFIIGVSGVPYARAATRCFPLSG